MTLHAILILDTVRKEATTLHLLAPLHEASEQ